MKPVFDGKPEADASLAAAASQYFEQIATDAGFEFMVGSGDERTLIMRDAQHEYVLEEVAEGAPN